MSNNGNNNNNNGARRQREQRARARPREPREPGGLQISRLPGPPSNLVKTSVPVHDAVENWSDLLFDPFSARAEGVYTPLSTTLVPCPSSKVRNYGTTGFTMPAGHVVATMYFYPSGSLTVDGLQGFGTNALVTPPTVQQFGPMLDGTNQLTQLAAAGMLTTDIGTPIQKTTPPVGVTMTAMPWDTLKNPFTIPTLTSDVKFKLTAFGVRISFVGKLTDTEGFVDFYNPYHWTGTPDDPKDLSSLRRDPSHRREYFSNKRTHTFVWHPNCESASYASQDRVTLFNPADKVSRFMLQVSGVEAGDKFEVEYIGFQEFTGHPAISTNTPSPITPDLVHVANAIPEMKGKMNRGASNGRRTNLAQHVAAQKVMASKALTVALPSNVRSAPTADRPSKVLQHITQGAGTAMKVASTLLPLLALL